MFDSKKIKEDFPILNKKVNGKELVYLDNAATSQKPQVVIDAISDYYSSHNSNVHRGVHTLSERATDMYEDARKTAAEFIGATIPDEIIFTKGVTESLNMVAFGWAVAKLSKDDVILVTESEHHSNLVPWQAVAKKTGATLRVLKMNENGEIPMGVFKKELTDEVKVVALSHTSNVLGTIFPIKEVCSLAKKVGAVVSVDGAQAIPHLKVNVQSLGCDFYSFSGHKMLGPMGTGVLWGRKELLEEMNPYLFGGGMINTVSTTDATWAKVPQKFEGGTPNVGGVIGLSAAMDYLQTLGMDEIRKHEVELVEYAIKQLNGIEGVRILGPKEAEKRSGLVSFVLEGIHAHDVGALLSEEGVAVRSGHHCTMPLHEGLSISSSVRASVYLYNDKADVDKLIAGVEKAKELFS
jgi:cysteine desulfurase/selenocysteine lyase